MEVSLQLGELSLHQRLERLQLLLRLLRTALLQFMRRNWPSTLVLNLAGYSYRNSTGTAQPYPILEVRI